VTTCCTGTGSTRGQATQQLYELARTAGLTVSDYTGVVVHGDATPHVIGHEQKCRSELIVMGKHGTRVTEELLLGSVTKRVLAESGGDVLVVVDPRAAARPRTAATSPRERSRPRFGASARPPETPAPSPQTSAHRRPGGHRFRGRCRWGPRWRR
jgi:hypothetical protein